MSLRQLAAAIGTSHRMLIYHFGSREGLLAAVTRAVEEQQAVLLEPGATRPDARPSWQRLSDPSRWPQERLFFELYASALRGRPGTEGFSTESSSPGSPRSPPPWSRPAPTNGRPGPTPVSAWLWSAACCSISSPPETVPESTRRMSGSSPAHRPPMRQARKRQTPTATPLDDARPASQA
ncbi:MAG TPA: TetR family transcriptional regulator [Streptosporangiaceae bacterium]|nr:TetR family transcriptional regulator [Streptosporangiaceae bacterium]